MDISLTHGENSLTGTQQGTISVDVGMTLVKDVMQDRSSSSDRYEVVQVVDMHLQGALEAGTREELQEAAVSFVKDLGISHTNAQLREELVLLMLLLSPFRTQLKLFQISLGGPLLLFQLLFRWQNRQFLIPIPHFLMT